MSENEEKKESQEAGSKNSAKAKLEQKIIEAKARSKRMMFSKNLKKSNKKEDK